MAKIYIGNTLLSITPESTDSSGNFMSEAAYTKGGTDAAITTAINNLIDSAPGSLDTLNELAEALNDDDVFHTTINNLINLKAPLASPPLTGIPTAPTAVAGTDTTQIATTAFVTAAVAGEDTIAEMNDVTLTSIADGELLVSSGSNFVNNTLAEAGIAPAASPTFTGDPANFDGGILLPTVPATAANVGIVRQNAYFKQGGIRLQRTNAVQEEMSFRWGGAAADTFILQQMYGNAAQGNITFFGNSPSGSNKIKIDSDNIEIGTASTTLTKVISDATIATNKKITFLDSRDATDGLHFEHSGTDEVVQMGFYGAVGTTDHGRFVITHKDGTAANTDVLTIPKGGASVTIHKPTTFTGTITGNVDGNLVGTAPTAPTAAAGTNDTQIATTAFVQSAVQGEDTIAEMNDVTLTSLADGELLVSSSGNFINQTLAEAGINAITLTTASQPNITGVGTLTGLTVSGAVTIDSQTLTVDSINDRVGIGTSGPISPLHVRKAVSGGNLVRQLRLTNDTDAQGTGTGIVFDMSGLESDGHHPYVNAAIDSIDTESGLRSGNLIFSTRPNDTGGDAAVIERMRINATGEVGIGKTATAGVELDVSGDIAASGSVSTNTVSAPSNLNLTAGSNNVTVTGAAVSVSADNLLLNENSLNISAASGGCFNISDSSGGTDFLSGNITTGVLSLTGELDVSGTATADTPTASTHLATKAYVDDGEFNFNVYQQNAGQNAAAVVDIGSTHMPTVDIEYAYIGAYTGILPAQLFKNKTYYNVNLKLNKGVTGFGDQCFAQGSTQGTLITPQITTLGNEVYLNNVYISGTVDIPDYVTTMGTGVFSGTSITAYTIGTGITTIPDSTFKDCASLNTLNFPSHITAIGAEAFHGCTGVNSAPSANTLTIPDNIITIGQEAFKNFGGGNIQTVSIGDGVTTIGDEAFVQSLTSTTSLSIGSSVTTIGDDAFAQINSVTSLTIPNNVTSIGVNAFSSAYSLSNVTFESGGTSLNIAADAFQDHYDATVIDLPAHLTALGNGAFDSNGVTFTGGTPLIVRLRATDPSLITITGSPFNNSNASDIEVPTSALSAYGGVGATFAGLNVVDGGF